MKIVKGKILGEYEQEVDFIINRFSAIDGEKIMLALPKLAFDSAKGVPVSDVWSIATATTLLIMKHVSFKMKAMDKDGVPKEITYRLENEMVINEWIDTETLMTLQAEAVNYSLGKTVQNVLAPMFRAWEPIALKCRESLHGIQSIMAQYVERS